MSCHGLPEPMSPQAGGAPCHVWEGSLGPTAAIANNITRNTSPCHGNLPGPSPITHLRAPAPPGFGICICTARNASAGFGTIRTVAYLWFLWVLPRFHTRNGLNPPTQRQILINTRKKRSDRGWETRQRGDGRTIRRLLNTTSRAATLVWQIPSNSAHCTDDTLRCKSYRSLLVLKLSTRTPQNKPKQTNTF